MLSGLQCSCKHAQFSLRSTDQQQLLQGRLQQHAAVCSRRPRLISNRHEVRAAPDDATPGSSSISNRRQQQQSSQTAAAVSADTDDGLRRKLLAAQQDFQQSLRQLKDSVGIAFIPGYKPTPPAAAAAANATGDNANSNGSSRQDGSKQRYRFSTKQQQQQRRPARFTTYRNLTAVAAAKQREKEEQQQQQQQQLQSIPARLGRILTGKFITERSNSSRSKKNSRQGFNAQTAAVQFELQSQLLDQAQQQQQQQQQRDGSAAAAAAGNAFNQVIDIRPDSAALPGAEPSPYKAAAAAAAAHFTDPAAAAAAAAEDADANDSAPEAPYPAVTNMLVLVMWAVFVLQWWPLLPELWLTVTRVGLLQAVAAVMLAIPDTAVTQALQLDFAAVQQGSLSGLLTAGLAHSGLAATWICTRALSTCGPFLEFGLGPMALIAIFLVTSLCSSVAHIIAGRSMTAVCGSGAVIGVFTAWAVLANKSLKHQIPARAVNVQLASLVLLNLVVGWLQPAVGIASIVGGLLGGALALLVAGPVAVALQWCLALPVIATLFLLKLMLDAAKGLLNAVLMVVVVISQWTASLVQSVRRV